jgi:hypothetical protein
MIDRSNIVCARADLLSTELDDELIMMDMESGRYLALNRVGAVIWRELTEPRKVDDLCRTLEERYLAPRGEIERDVLNLLRQMEAEKLIYQHI